MTFRLKRIERLLAELEYEITRGMMERDIDERLNFQFIVPLSSNIPDGVVFCEFRTKPMLADNAGTGFEKPTLRVIK